MQDPCSSTPQKGNPVKPSLGQMSLCWMLISLLFRCLALHLPAYLFLSISLPISSSLYFCLSISLSWCLLPHPWVAMPSIYPTLDRQCLTLCPAWWVTQPTLSASGVGWDRGGRCWVEGRYSRRWLVCLVLWHDG